MPTTFITPHDNVFLSIRADTDDGTRLSYQGCVFHRVVKDFAVIGGDIAVSEGQ